MDTTGIFKAAQQKAEESKHADSIRLIIKAIRKKETLDAKIKQLTATYAKIEAALLDPWMGSGSTGVACVGSDPPLHRHRARPDALRHGAGTHQARTLPGRPLPFSA